MKKIIYVLLALSILASCSTKVPFTTKALTDYKLTNDDVQKLQFYVKGDLVLTNGKSDNSTKTEGGELVIRDEQNWNKVIIPSGTRGIVEKVDGDILYVSFEEGKNLLFKASPTNGKYRIKSEKFDPRKRMGTVTYGGEVFLVNSSGLQAFLMFKLKNSTKRQSSARSVKGRKL